MPRVQTKPAATSLVDAVLKRLQTTPLPGTSRDLATSAPEQTPVASNKPAVVVEEKKIQEQPNPVKKDRLLDKFRSFMSQRSAGRQRGLCSNVRVELSTFEQKKNEEKTEGNVVKLLQAPVGKENQIPIIFELKSDDGTVIQVSMSTFFLVRKR
jgi:hypothetical protein